MQEGNRRFVCGRAVRMVQPAPPEACGGCEKTERHPAAGCAVETRKAAEGETLEKKKGEGMTQKELNLGRMRKETVNDLCRHYERMAAIYLCIARTIAYEDHRSASGFARKKRKRKT